MTVGPICGAKLFCLEPEGFQKPGAAKKGTGSATLRMSDTVILIPVRHASSLFLFTHEEGPKNQFLLR